MTVRGRETDDGGRREGIDLFHLLSAGAVGAKWHGIEPECEVGVRKRSFG